MDAVDAYIPTPERDVEKTFLMAIEDVFSITGRGTVATGRIDRGIVKVGDNVEIVGVGETQTTTITGKGDGYIFMVGASGGTDQGNLVFATGDTGSQNDKACF